MHEYTETESKYTSKIGGHIACENKCRSYFEVKIMPSKARLKIFEI